MKYLAPLCALIALPALASEDLADQYPASELYSKPVEVIPHVFSAIGATAPPTYENAGHNNNLSFIVTGDGVVVVNSGASYKLAEALHADPSGAICRTTLAGAEILICQLGNHALWMNVEHRAVMEQLLSTRGNPPLAALAPLEKWLATQARIVRRERSAFIW